MNKKGFTLVELLATIVVLAIVVGLTIMGIAVSVRNAKKKTEEVFIGTLRDAINIYLDDESNMKDFYWQECPETKISKINGEATLYYAGNPISFNDIIASSYSPIIESDLKNPATEKTCDPGATAIQIYKDSDDVYYYSIDKYELNAKDSHEPCLLNNDENIANLPEEINCPKIDEVIK